MAIIIFVIWFRKYAEQVGLRDKLVNEKWRDTLFEVANDDEKPFIGPLQDTQNKGELISQKDSPHFLRIWNYIHESLRGDSKLKLNAFAKRYSVDKHAVKMLESHLIKNRLLALNTLGNLGDKSTYEEILNFAFKDDPIVSVWAFRAMFRIDPKETIQHQLYMIAERNDWSSAHVAKILNECESDLLSRSLVNVCRRYYEKKLSEKQLAYLVSYLQFAHRRDSSPIIERILEESDEMEVLISCLRLITSTRSLPRIRALLDDKRWRLRMFAVDALAKFGITEDVKILQKALDDENWWVRYHAAHALISMPTIDLDRIKKLSVMVETAFERDILLQIWAETEFKCKNQSFTKL